MLFLSSAHKSTYIALYLQAVGETVTGCLNVCDTYKFLADKFLRSCSLWTIQKFSATAAIHSSHTSACP